MAEQAQCASLRDENDRLQYLDPLTGYLNAMGFQRWAAEIMTEHPERKYALSYTDINGSNIINDAFGYETRDRLLRPLGQDHPRRPAGGEILGRTSGDNLTFLTYYENEAELERRFWNRVQMVRGYPERAGTAL